MASPFLPELFWSNQTDIGNLLHRAFEEAMYDRDYDEFVAYLTEARGQIDLALAKAERHYAAGHWEADAE